MPIYQAPRSDADRLVVLTKIPVAEKIDRDAGHPYLDTVFVGEVVAFLATFRPAYDAIAKSTGNPASIAPMGEFVVPRSMPTIMSGKVYLKILTRTLGIPRRFDSFQPLTRAGEPRE